MPIKEIKIKLLSANKTKEELLSSIIGLYVSEASSEDEILSKALSELHNSAEINLIELFSSIDKNLYENDFFKFLRIFSKALPLLNAEIEDVLGCLVHLVGQMGDNLAIGGISFAFECFCRAMPYRPGQCIEFILKKCESDLYIPFLSGAILAYESNHSDEVISIIKKLIINNDKKIRQQVYIALGRLHVSEHLSTAVWLLLHECATDKPDGECCALILKAMLHFGETYPSYWLQLENLLLPFVEDASTELHYAISDITAFQSANLPESILRLFVKQLANVSPEDNGSIDNIDYLLVKLVTENLCPLAVELLESILISGVKFKSLAYFSRELLNDYIELRNHIITKWFLCGEPSLCYGVTGLLMISDKNIEIKADMTLLDNIDKQIFVCKKAIGWLFVRPIAAANFILSICDTASESILKEIEGVLYSPLLLSYPGELEVLFQSYIERNVQRNLCQCLLNKLYDFHSNLESIRDLKELMAPTENINTYWKDNDRDMQKAYDEASKYSIVNIIATTQRLLYGNSSIYYIYDGNGKSIRQEMQLKSFSHSAEMPRLSVLDPEGLNYILLTYRHEEINSEANS